MISVINKFVLNFQHFILKALKTIHFKIKWISTSSASQSIKKRGCWKNGNMSTHAAREQHIMYDYRATFFLAMARAIICGWCVHGMPVYLRVFLTLKIWLRLKHVFAVLLHHHSTSPVHSFCSSYKSKWFFKENVYICATYLPNS